MILPDVWPRQRANAKRKALTPADRAYRQRVRKNKTKAAAKAQSERVSTERKEQAKQRTSNRKQIAMNAAQHESACKNTQHRGK